MRVSTTKSRNSESFYITKSYINNQGKSTSKIIRKLGTLNELSQKLSTDRDGVMAWAKEQARIETEKYEKENGNRTVLISFYSDRQLDYHKKKLFEGGYLFLQYIYYGLKIDQICRRIKRNYKFGYDLNAILSNMIYMRILELPGVYSSFNAARKLLEPPAYEAHDICHALSILAKEYIYIQSEVYKNSSFFGERNGRILYYDCINFNFEIPKSVIQMGLFMDGDGIPMAFSLFLKSQNEQVFAKSLEKKIFEQFGCDKFIYCADAELDSENNKICDYIGKRAFIVTQSIKKMSVEERSWALNRTGFKRLADGKTMDITNLSDEDKNSLFYKEEPDITKKRNQRLIITYSPKYAAYQKNILKEKRNVQEEQYDGLYAVYTDLLDGNLRDILQACENRWQIGEYFHRIEEDFLVRYSKVRIEDRIFAHFLINFLSFLICRVLKKNLNNEYTCEEIINTLKEMNFADIEEQGYMPLYSRGKITDDLHEACGFRTDYQFITKQKMKEIQKKSKGRE